MFIFHVCFPGWSAEEDQDSVLHFSPYLVYGWTSVIQLGCHQCISLFFWVFFSFSLLIVSPKINGGRDYSIHTKLGCRNINFFVHKEVVLQTISDHFKGWKYQLLRVIYHIFDYLQEE